MSISTFWYFIFPLQYICMMTLDISDSQTKIILLFMTRTNQIELWADHRPMCWEALLPIGTDNWLGQESIDPHMKFLLLSNSQKTQRLLIFSH